MEKLELPFNVTKMSEDDIERLIDSINFGNQEVLLEVRDSENKLKGFQTVLTLDKQREIVSKRLEYLAELSTFYEDRKANKKIIKGLRKIVENYVSLIKEISSLKTMLIDDYDDLVREFSDLGSYTEEEVISKKLKDITYRIN